MTNSTPKNDMTFFENVKKLCAANGMSVTALGQALGLSNATTAGWRKGSQPRGKTLKMIADYFDVTVDQLIDRPIANTNDNQGVVRTTHDPVRDSIVQSTDPDELDIIRIYRMLDRRSKHEFMMMVYEYERRME